jgi:tetratricopeptide (TPR) repeat protein
MTQDVRVYNWQAALDQAHVNPLFGTGSGTHLIFGRLFRRPAIQTDPVHAHSDYLEMLAEYGIVGEALALILLAVHLVHGATGAYQIAVKRLRGSQGPARSDVFALSIGAVCATAALVSHSVVDFNMHIPGNALFYAFVFGILANPGAERNPATPNWISPSTLFRALLPPLGIVTLFVINPLITPELLTEQARVALRDQRFKECIAKARDAADDDPKNPFPHYYAGEANRVTGLALGSNIALRKSYFTSAINSFTAGLKVFPLDENMLVRSAQCLDATLQLKAADEAYQKAIRWDPNLGVLYAYYASHLHVLGRSTVEKAYRDTAGRLGSPNPQTTGMAEVHSMLELKSDKSSTSPTPENAATTLD